MIFIVSELQKISYFCKFTHLWNIYRCISILLTFYRSNLNKQYQNFRTAWGENTITPWDNRGTNIVSLWSNSVNIDISTLIVDAWNH